MNIRYNMREYIKISNITLYSGCCLFFLIHIVSCAIDPYDTQNSYKASELHGVVDIASDQDSKSQTMYVFLENKATDTLDICSLVFNKKDEVIDTQNCNPVYYDAHQQPIKASSLNLSPPSPQQWREYLKYAKQNLHPPNNSTNTQFVEFLKGIGQLVVIFAPTFAVIHKLSEVFPPLKNGGIFIAMLIAMIFDYQVTSAVKRQKTYNYPFHDYYQQPILFNSTDHIFFTDFIKEYMKKIDDDTLYYDMPNTMDLPGIAQKLAIFLNVTRRTSSRIITYCYPFALTKKFHLTEKTRNIFQNESHVCSRVFATNPRDYRN